ncbi:urease accessory protein [Fulvimarina endophytica]|uniref:Urease accessory protein n=1 Tax=Fulvimarina endophytica TaxID=2293836 RepID=A0A371X494_9HYPH|nr:HupE/UreJ family protein [Fulvimarina endophytica]RFC64037.1 urease accessory protein [Fulvimarina endophytica]
MLRSVLILAAVLIPSAAFAHTGAGDPSGFLHGFTHPIGGLDHILAMVAVGVFAYVLGGRALWLVPCAFVGMMVIGFALGVAGTEIPFVELGIALSSVVIGGAAALGRPMPVGIAMALVGVFAIFHGHAHGSEMPETSGGLAYAAGFIAATAMLHAIGILAAFGTAKAIGRYGRTAARIAGATFALGGVGVLTGYL